MHAAPTAIYAELERGKPLHTQVGRKYIITRGQFEDYKEEKLLNQEEQDTPVAYPGSSDIDDASQWLDAVAQDMFQGIAAIECDVPEAGRQEWLKAIETAVKSLELDDA